MRSTRFLVGAAVLLASMSVMAQFQWIDGNGRRVYSDKPPPASVPDENILSGSRVPLQPQGRAAESPANEPGEPGDAEAQEPGGAPGVDEELEERKARAEAQQREREERVQAEQAAARAENCRRARNLKTGLASGVRMARMNDQGEREVLGDEQRAEEMRRADQLIAANCDPA